MLEYNAPFLLYNQFSTIDSSVLNETNQFFISKPINIGLFIGTFDPITNAHLECAKRSLRLLDEVWFCPNLDKENNKRDHQNITTRVKMIELAISNIPRLKTYIRQNKSTLRSRGDLIDEVMKKKRNVTIWIIMGSDKLESSVYKKFHSEVHKTGHIIFQRSEHLDIEKFGNFDLFISMDAVGTISSSQVKTRLQYDKPIDNLVPTEVSNFIKSERLYQNDRERNPLFLSNSKFGKIEVESVPFSRG